MTTRTRLRAVRGLCALTAGVCVLVVSGASPAHAASYRYWTYWQATAGAQDWTFASQGPGTFVPADGAVEGWRYAITTQAASTPPDPAPDFSSVCRSTPEQADRKRVALVVDSGPTGIGPAGEDAPALLTACVVADVDATGYAILSSIVDVRTESGLVCGLDGYPAAECAPVVDDAEIAAASARTESTAPAPSPSTAAPASAALASPDGSGGSPLTTIVVAALLLGGATLALVLRRRGR